jgi:NADPH:quinone reductase-like Zn-dependent oxidoreductase
MEGVVINKNGGTEVLEFKTDLPVPQPKENQVLIKNEYVGVNYIDTYVISKPISTLSYNDETDRC